MELKDRRISHLKNLGETRQAAIRMLEKELEINSDFLEIAEITDSHVYRDGGLPNKSVEYVAGICGSRDAGEGDFGDDVYSLVYFNGMVKIDGNWKNFRTVYSNNLKNIIDYTPLKSK
jgi:hypothetical protein